MGRGEKPVPDDGSPEAEFAASLRRLRQSAGLPTYRLMAVTGHVAATSLSRAAAGHHLPSRDVLTGFVTACGGDITEWTRRWETAVRASALRHGLDSEPSAGDGDHLPRPDPYFVGRAAETDKISSLLRSGQPAPIVAIGGMGGIGKTALALHVAHRLADDFPDGLFHIDLYGHSPLRAPLSTVPALEALLRMSGDTGVLPQSADQLAARWRTSMAGRRALIILDDAIDDRGLEPLLPGGSGCGVITTGRRSPATLSGVRPLRLGPLSAAEGGQLFTAVAGAADEPLEVERVIALCGGLPLAIRLAAVRLRSRPAWTVAHLAELLGDSSRRLRLLSMDSASVAAVLDSSYAALPADSRRLLHSVSRLPANEFTAAHAAEIAEIAPALATELLDDLIDAAVLEQTAADTYQIHDLMKLHVRTAAAGQDFRPELAAPASRPQHARRWIRHDDSAGLAVPVPVAGSRRRRVTGTAPAIKSLSFGWSLTPGIGHGFLRMGSA